MFYLWLTMEQKRIFDSTLFLQRRQILSDKNFFLCLLFFFFFFSIVVSVHVG